jgi:hypothetical protein
MKIVIVDSLEEAQRVTEEGKLPAVDMVKVGGPQLSDQLHKTGIRQALWKECYEAIESGELVLPR